MNPIQRTFAGLSNIWNGGLNPATYTQASTTPAGQQGSVFIKGVPAQYQSDVAWGAQHTGIPAQNLSAQINGENGGNWSPTLRGRRDPNDFGITQLNPAGVGIITGKTGPMQNYFKANTGEDFDRTNPDHQLKGMFIYQNYLKQYGLPSAGMKNPTTSDIQTSYNTGAEGLSKAKAGDPTWSARARTYQNLMNSKLQ